MCEFGGNNTKLCKMDKCKICFEKSFASHEKVIYWSKNNQLTPRNVFKKTDKKYFFDCPTCKHDFDISLDNLARGKWCGYCNNSKLCSSDKCNICLEKSFASHDKVIFWSTKNKENPRNVFKKTNKKFLFNCDKCKHSFEKELAKISYENGWCPYCAHQKLCDNDDCEMCYDMCFESHPKAKYWSKKNTKHPGDVFKNSASKYWFDCPTCGHDYEKALFDMDRYGCPYCGNQQLCSNDKCQNCFNKSFASSDKAKYLDPENKINPRSIFKSSEKKYDFICEKKHKFTSALNKINCDNTWCPFCIRKTEAKLYDWLVEKYKNVEREKRFEWCKQKKALPFDFFLPEYNLLIELDGNQHFEQIQNWQSPDITQETDKLKNNKALENGYSIIRISQEDVFKDKNDWEHILENKIKNYESPIEIKIGDKY